MSSSSTADWVSLGKTFARDVKSFLGIASSDDLKGLVSTDDLNKATSCTQLINRVHVCSVPKYDKIVEPKDFTLGMLTSSKEKMCLHFDHLPDVVGTERAEAMSGRVGHGDFPDNYVCFDGKLTAQYVEAMVPAAELAQLASATSVLALDPFRQ